MSEAAAEKPSVPKGEYMSPIGPEFWIGLAAMIGCSLAAIWFAARAGFADAARFRSYDECRTARNTLRTLRGDVEDNLRQLAKAREDMKTPRLPDIHLRTENLALASTKSYSSLIDPFLLAEIDRLFSYPLSLALDRIRSIAGPVRPDDTTFVVPILTKVIDRAEKEVLPLLRAQETALDQLELGLQEAR